MTASDPGQMSMFSIADAREGRPRWWGLATDHRRLFAALEEGWLHPAESRTGFVLGVGAYAVERNEAPAGHPVLVRMRLDTAKLPASDVSVCRGDQWVSSRLGAVESTDAALYWPGVLPAFAIVGISVSTEEERRRLEGLARAVSNVDLADLDVDVDSDVGETVKTGDPPPDGPRTLVVPQDEDAVRGAMSMAMWAVPRIDPWLDLLVASLASDLTRLRMAAAAVDAGWWKFVPWTRVSDEPRPSGVDERLWRAAVDVFRDRPVEGRPRLRDLAERVAVAASRLGCSTGSDAISAWLEATHGILRVESTIDFDGWRACPVGVAVQLVLTRPDPESFRTWFQDRPDLPPAVAWSGAVLCGLLRGYRGLAKRFRGDRLQRELLSIHAWRACGGEADLGWPSLPDEAPQWRREGGQFVLSWGGRDFARKPENARGRWYAADFQDGRVRREAQAVARKQGWACLHREIELQEGRFPLSGSAEIIGVGSERRLAVQGTVRMRLPAAAVVEDGLDDEAFRRAAALEAGTLPDPPVAPAQDVRPGPAIAEPRCRERRDDVAPGRSVRSEPTEVPGLTYVPDFLSEREETELVAAIDGAGWNSDLQRRVQHYGWRYNYKARQIDVSMRLGLLPEWAARLAGRLVSEGLLSDLPDQVIVNEYVGNQSIAKHVDSESFADGIATISLLESWGMVFREKKKGGSKKEVRLDRRSAAIMTGDARYHWTHEIPKRKHKHKPGRVARGRRISLTFRKVLASAVGGRALSTVAAPRGGSR